MIVGLDQFSYHRFFGDIFPWEKDPNERWALCDFLDHATAFNVKCVGLHVHYLTDDEIANLGDMLAQHSLSFVLEWGHPDGLKMGTSYEAVDDLRRWMAIAASLNCRLMRIVAGCQTWRGREPVEMQIDRIKPILREVCREAVANGLTLAIENHADFTPQELVRLVERVDDRALKICFDTGNCVRLGADLIESARFVAPYTAMVHMKDILVLETSIGNPNASWPSAPLGHGSLNIAVAVDVLRQHGFDGPVFIEMAQMHPDWPDEDDAIAQSVRLLDSLVSDICPKA